MKVHHAAGIRPRAIERAVHEHLLRRLVARDVLELGIEPRQPRRIQPPEARVGRRDQIAIVQARADIAGAADGEAAREQAGGEIHQEMTGFVLGHVWFRATARPPVVMAAPARVDPAIMCDFGRCPTSCCHGSTSKALMKKSRAPKLPDFNASSSGVAPPSA